MSFEEFMINKRILNNENYLTNKDALQLFISNLDNFDIIKFNHLKKLLILHIPVMESNNDGKYYFDYEFVRDCDIIDEFKFEANGLDIKFSFICGLHEYNINEIKEFLLVSSTYNSFKLRITFNEIFDVNKEIYLYYSKSFCKYADRYYLMNNKITTSSIIYHHGMCMPININ